MTPRPTRLWGTLAAALVVGGQQVWIVGELALFNVTARLAK